MYPKAVFLGFTLFSPFHPFLASCKVDADAVLQFFLIYKLSELVVVKQK